jgi:hypothetical protein
VRHDKLGDDCYFPAGGGQLHISPWSWAKGLLSVGFAGGQRAIEYSGLQSLGSPFAILWD